MSEPLDARPGSEAPELLSLPWFRTWLVGVWQRLRDAARPRPLIDLGITGVVWQPGGSARVALRGADAAGRVGSRGSRHAGAPPATHLGDSDAEARSGDRDRRARRRRLVRDVDLRRVRLDRAPQRRGNVRGARLVGGAPPS